MLTTIDDQRVWTYSSDPDNEVHDILGNYAQSGDIFFNSNDIKFYFCHQGGADQIWGEILSEGEIMELISAIPQSDWNQSNPANSNYIKNKPSLSTVATTGFYSDLSGKPSLSTVATSGAYSDLSGKPTLSTVATSGNYSDLLGKPTLATVATSGSYLDLSNKPSIPSAQIQSDWNETNNTLLDYIKNKPTIPATQIQSDWNQTNVSSLDYIKNKPLSRSQSSASRTLNSAFQISSTRDCLVNYSVDISTTVSLTGSQVGTVVLETATNSGFTTGVQTIQQFSNGNSGTLVIGLVLTQLNSACLSGYIPLGNYVRLRTVNVTGTPTFTYQIGQEILI